MSGPIRPADVLAVKQRQLPKEVFEAFNELVAESFSNGSAVVRQNDVIKRILSKMPGVTRERVFNDGWLNVEDAYRNQGWNVDHDRPGYNEMYEATFTFTVRRAT
jgi:hypothetical protein